MPDAPPTASMETQMKPALRLPALYGAGLLASSALAAAGAALRSCMMSTEALLARSICGPGADMSAAMFNPDTTHCAGCVMLAAGLGGMAVFAGLGLARLLGQQRRVAAKGHTI